MFFALNIYLGTKLLIIHELKTISFTQSVTFLRHSANCSFIMHFAKLSRRRYIFFQTKPQTQTQNMVTNVMSSLTIYFPKNIILTEFVRNTSCTFSPLSQCC